MKNKARELRALLDASVYAVQKFIRVDELTQEELSSLIAIYPRYKPNVNYKVKDEFRYGDKLYEVIQEHTSLENWNPNELPALYKEKLPKQVIPDWKKPTGAHDAYKIGDKVIFEGDIYTSKINSNTWSPTEYTAGWERNV